MKDSTSVISLIEKALTPQAQEEIEEIGTVIGVGDGICKVYGLTNAVYGELVTFESGNRGIIMDLDEDFVSIVLLPQCAGHAHFEVSDCVRAILCSVFQVSPDYR